MVVNYMRKEAWSRIGEQFKQMNVPYAKLVFNDEKRKPKSLGSSTRKYLSEKYNIRVRQRQKEYYLMNLDVVAALEHYSGVHRTLNPKYNGA